MSGLTKLYIDGTNFTERGILEVAQLPKLEKLSVKGIRIDYSTLRKIRSENPRLKIYV